MYINPNNQYILITVSADVIPIHCLFNLNPIHLFFIQQAVLNSLTKTYIVIEILLIDNHLIGLILLQLPKFIRLQYLSHCFNVYFNTPY